ncbi:MAG: hydroxymethylbilane synthase [Armatimonadota bacterium]|nr:MAG: hydroxymethylbilane synthase [Armatimonadota bacterium]
MIRLGTRGSKLALAQAESVADVLTREGAQVEIVIITTTGDRSSSAPTGSATGIFVKELETELLRRRIDLAAHSLKDMPTDLPAGLALGAVLRRASALDALVSRDRGTAIHNLPHEAGIGTSSPRRSAQLLAYRRDLDVRPVRGNVDTRLRKLDAGEFDAIVLAQAGLERLGLAADTRPYVIPPGICLPAPGQGAVAVEVRGDDERMAELLQPLEDAETRACVTAERAFLKALGGGCRAPVGALGTMSANGLRIEGVVVSPDGKDVVRGARDGAADDALAVGQALARDLQERGAGALIEAAR